MHLNLTTRTISLELFNEYIFNKNIFIYTQVLTAFDFTSSPPLLPFLFKIQKVKLLSAKTGESLSSPTIAAWMLTKNFITIIAAVDCSSQNLVVINHILFQPMRHPNQFQQPSDHFVRELLEYGQTLLITGPFIRIFIIKIDES